MCRGGWMNRRSVIAGMLFAVVSLAPFRTHVIADEQPLFGYSTESSRTERQWEEKLRAIPSPNMVRGGREFLHVSSQIVGGGNGAELFFPLPFGAGRFGRVAEERLLVGGDVAADGSKRDSD